VSMGRPATRWEKGRLGFKRNAVHGSALVPRQPSGNPGERLGAGAAGKSPPLNYALSTATRNTNNRKSGRIASEAAQTLRRVARMPVGKAGKAGIFLRRVLKMQAEANRAGGAAQFANEHRRHYGQQGRLATTGGGGGAGMAVGQQGEAAVVPSRVQQW
jgi:hypothetical protein